MGYCRFPEGVFSERKPQKKRREKKKTTLKDTAANFTEGEKKS